MESTEYKNYDLLKVLAYPFIIHSTSHLSVRDFLFSISLDALSCSPSTALLLLNCGIQKGLLIFDLQKEQITTTFNYYEVNVLFHPEAIEKIIKVQCKNLSTCCENLSSLKNLYSSIALNNSSIINGSYSEDKTIISNTNKISNLLDTNELKSDSRNNNKKKKNKSKRRNHGTLSLEDYF